MEGKKKTRSEKLEGARGEKKKKEEEEEEESKNANGTQAHKRKM